MKKTLELLLPAAKAIQEETKGELSLKDAMMVAATLMCGDVDLKIEKAKPE